MANFQRPQAWLTHVTQRDHVTSALILAESLRRTRTTKRIGVIIGGQLSSQDGHSLRHSFDDLFCLDQRSQKPSTSSSTENEDDISIRAKIFALSLDIFGKCVFLEPNSLMLENGDKLFEGQDDLFLPLINGDMGHVGSHSSDYFLFTPCLPFSEYLEEQVSTKNGIGFMRFLMTHARKWAENNVDHESMEWMIGEDKDSKFLQGSVMQLSMNKGDILKKEHWDSPSIIQLVDGPAEKNKFVDKLQALLESNATGLTEKAIIKVYLRISEEIKATRPSKKRELHYPNEPIAIIGIGCRLPGANNLEDFWNLLYSGQEGGSTPPPFRWKKEHSVLPIGEKERQTWAGFLNTSVDEFDAKFFGVSPKEAVFMDPQTRLLHEVLWESLENGGVDPSTLYGTHTGIFTGSWLNDYKEIVHFSSARDFFRTYMGNSIGASAARLSHFLGLTGPCIATESGCSSAIVAVDMAVKSLRCGETNMALAGGVNLLLHPFTSDIMEYVIAPNGRSKTFDAKADGFGRAEGCCFLALKRLSDALRDRDNIWAMIRGSAVSQEGISRSLGTPTVHCEALAMTLALKNAGVRPEEVTFVETHGTGTSVGDPMEVTAIAKAYHSRKRKSPLVIGSVKTNVGHTESCSGITGMIKTILAMQQEMIPKHLNLDTLNPDINLEVIPAVIPLESIPWPKVSGQPRIAGVSSFGITGTDGHVILQEAPEYQLPKLMVNLERPLHLLKISAKTGEALDELLGKYETLFTGDQETFSDVAFTANTGRASFDHRAFLLASNSQDAAVAIQQNKLHRAEIGSDSTGNAICFLFTGQGSQYPGMARSLYETSPVFRFHFDHCERTLQENHNLSIRQVIWESGQESSELSRTIFSQTAIFCVEYCLLRLWQSWGLHPTYVLGHSLGEFCAAVAACILTFSDALKLVAVRSRLIDNLPRGSMLVIKASQPEVEDIIRKSNMELDFAAVNSPEQTVVAGDTAKIEALLKICEGKGIKGIILEATHAFHSCHMDSMLEEYRKVAKRITYGKPANGIQYISGMEGKVMEELDSNYWVDHTRQRVNFMKACQTLKDLDCRSFLELGPHPVLSTFVLQNLEDSGPITCYPSLRRNKDDWETILTSLGKLYLAGHKIDWTGYDKPYPRNKVTSLPFYPFHRKSYWVDCTENAGVIIHPLLGSQLSNASNLSIFQNDLKINAVPYLRDHCIGTRVVFPGAGFTEMCLSAGYCVSNFIKEEFTRPSGPVALENVRIEAPLELKEDKSCRLQVIVDLPEQSTSEDHEGWNRSQGFRCKVFHRNTSDCEGSGKWVSHSTATFYPVVSGTNELLQNWNGDRVRELISSKEPMSMDTFYKKFDEVGLKFGETFRSIQKQWSMQQEELGDLQEVVSEMKIPPDFDKYLLHPVVIDAMFHTQILANLKCHASTSSLRVPIRVGRLVLFGNKVDSISSDQSSLYLHAKWTEKEKCTIFACTQNFIPIAMMEDIELLESNVKTIVSVLEQQNKAIPDCWEETWKPIPGPNDDRVNLIALQPILSTPEFDEKLHKASKVADEDRIHAKNLDRLVCLYSLRALYQLGWSPNLREEITASEFCERFKIAAPHKQLVYFYFTMCDDELGMLKLIKPDVWKVIKVPYKTEAQISSQIDALFDILVQEPKVSAVTKTYQNISSHLTSVLTGSVSPLPILFPTEPEKQHLSAETFYLKHPGRPDFESKCRETLSTLWGAIRLMNGTDSRKILRVLEVGAGTGSLSVVALEQLRNIQGPDFEYYYTDISASFFVKAGKSMEDFKDNLKFATFNIEQDPLSQGIPLNYFDCVLGSDVLHATKNLKECLGNLRMTMRPQGILTFTDTLIPDKGITFVFGLLEGYWRFEDFDIRPHHTCVSAQVWEELLLDSGFNHVHCCEIYLGKIGCLVAEASDLPGYDKVRGTKLTPVQNKRWILFAPEVSKDIMKVSSVLTACGFKVEIIYPSMMAEDDDNCEIIYSLMRGSGEDGDLQGIIYAWGAENGILDQTKLALPFMHIAKQMLQMKKPPRLFVITRNVRPVTDNGITNPSPSTLLGMAKALKNENTDLFIRGVDLDASSDINACADQILFELATFKENKEKERGGVAYRDGQRFEPRFSRVVIPPGSESDLHLPPSTDRYKLILPKTRVINDLEFGVLEEERVGDGEVEIRTCAYALNFRDIFAILKPSAEFEKINSVGLDFAGVVTKIGSGVTSDKVKVGDRVFGVNLKEIQLPSHLTCEADDILRIPDRMTFAEACTLPAVFSTSIYCLIQVAKLKKGETVLIHTGSGGVGLSAIQLASQIGAKIITTAGSPRKRAYLRSLGICHVFHSRNTSYQEDIMRVTGGRGVDVVLNSITGPGFKEASLAVCAANARFIEMSKLSVWTEEDVRQRRPDVQYSIVDLTSLDKNLLRDLQAKTQQDLDKGAISPIPFVQFDALRVRQALHFFQKAKHIGKVVVTMPEVKTERGGWKVKVALFNPASTYLITGGLGGIGFEVCKWMLEKGASDIVLLGRSAPKPEIYQEIDRLNKTSGVNVMIRLCDVGNYEDLKKVIDELASCGDFKPIRGIHHCAGVLADNLYTNQTWPSFRSTFNPKVEGTWNLHRLTSHLNLEQFVLYSSQAALLGPPGQSNHSAANCFEDAFAHYRHFLGLPATTINWGQWAQVGCAKEVNVTSIMPVSYPRMLNGLEEAIRGQRVQVSFGEFESLNMLTAVFPLAKYYLDDRLLKSLNSSSGQDSTSFLLQSGKFWEEVDQAPNALAKVEVVGQYLKAILRNALRMDPDEPIKDDANMQDLGVDSLMLIELRNSIQSLLGARLTVGTAALKDCQTIRQLATVIVNKIQDDDESDGQDMVPLSKDELEELLKEDCVLEESIRATNVNHPSSVLKTVLVTGATGQLGPYILTQLCRISNLERIICLIRSREDVAPEERLVNVLKSMNLENQVDMDKVECVQGDVTLVNFGLDQEHYDKLCKSVDGIIHLAVKSKFADPYRKLEGGKTDVRSVNVGGTLEILRFASTQKTKTIFYSSSILSVFGGVNLETLSDLWPETEDAKTLLDLDIPGYPISKFVGEMLLKQANERGIPCKVFRFPWIMGDSASGQLNYHNNPYVLRFMAYLKLKAMPCTSIPAILLPVDTCAEWSVKLFWNSGAPCQVYNITHPSPQLEVEFVDVAKQEFDADLELVDWKNTEFIERLYATDIPLEILKELYQDLDKITPVFTSKSFQAVQGYINFPETFFRNERLEQYLPGFGKDLPSSMDIMRSSLRFVRRTPYFEKFRF